jgi:hypothetical protein
MIRVTIASHFRSRAEVLVGERTDVESLDDAKQALRELAGKLEKYADTILGVGAELVVRIAVGSFEPMPATRPSPPPQRQVQRDDF